MDLIKLYHKEVSNYYYRYSVAWHNTAFKHLYLLKNSYIMMMNLNVSTSGMLLQQEIHTSYDAVL